MTYSEVKIENQNRERSHKLGRIGVRRIRTFPFSSNSNYDSTYDQVNKDWKQKQKNEPITRPRIENCHYKGYSSASASHSDNLVFTKS